MLKKIHQSIYMPYDLRHELDAISERVGISTNALIVVALREYVRDNPLFPEDRDENCTSLTD